MPTFTAFQNRAAAVSPMLFTRLAPFALACLSLACSTTHSPGPNSISVQNNHPFPVHMPFTLHDSTGQSTSTILVDVPPHAQRFFDPALPPHSATSLTVSPAQSAVSLSYNQKDLGKLSWSLVLHPVSAETTRNDALSVGRPADFKPQPLSLSFRPSSRTLLFTTYSASTDAAGLHVTVDLDVYPAGYLDIHTTVTNRSAPTQDVYAAVLTNWTQPTDSHLTCDYDTTLSSLTSSTPWRAPGEHIEFIARGLNWINADTPAGAVLWLNAFAPSFTVHHDAHGKTPAEWIGANSAQLDQEAYLDHNTLVHVTELAHGNIKSYRSRLDNYVLPDPSQPLTFTHRLLFSNKPASADEATNAFVAYTTFNSQKPATRNQQPATSTLNLGVPSVTFGTAYFPYSTLGENFISQKLPGMSQDSYWPLAADVVKNYPLFAEDIKRDLRLAKSMGFTSIRMHHMEMLWTTDKDPVQVTPEQRTAFLDFFFGQLKHLGMTALVDVRLTPDQIADLVKRYRPQIDGVEIDNEVLIFGIKDEDIPVWKKSYAAVKAVAPDMPVHLTAHTNTAAFKRLEMENVPFDRIGQHAYMDSLAAIPQSRDLALQVANFASTINKPPVITEWNWRFLTRMTEEARAKVYAPIFGNVLKAGAMPEMYQFQFNDSLAMSPDSLKGIRHYELLNLSRRPKAEALVFDQLVREYSDPASAFRTLETHYQHVTFPIGTPFALPDILVSVKNNSDQTLHITASAEGPADLHPTLTTPASFTLKPHAVSTAQLHVTFPKDALPGFYDAFVRFQTDDGQISYAPVEIRRPGQPIFDKSSHTNITASADAFDLDLSKPTAVIYGDDCPVMELEAAWVVYQTLEAATGVPVHIYTASEFPKNDPHLANFIFVGTPKSLPQMPLQFPAGQAITRIPNSTTLVISGLTSKEATLAAMDYTLRYWKTAKDAACRRVPLEKIQIRQGPDAGQLP